MKHACMGNCIYSGTSTRLHACCMHAAWKCINCCMLQSLLAPYPAARHACWNHYVREYTSYNKLQKCLSLSPYNDDGALVQSHVYILQLLPFSVLAAPCVLLYQLYFLRVSVSWQGGSVSTDAHAIQFKRVMNLNNDSRSEGQAQLLLMQHWLIISVYSGAIQLACMIHPDHLFIQGRIDYNYVTEVIAIYNIFSILIDFPEHH